ncbi:uncharacterized protein LOC101241558 isoform X2 [Hydra vulgaris]|uniref:Uncharacterized protein LOC101241558 isoform X2 n=1 Tax=Hydra vulgaris TaxID=6087 RepID=A0ABM4BL87_HYDVU
MPKRRYNVLKSLKENNVETELQSMILTQELKFNSKVCRQVNHFTVSKGSKQTIFYQQFGKENILKKRKMADGDENKITKPNIGEDVQHLLNDQIRIREGAMKLISACSTLNQALEASKNLLTINARILGLMSALQKQKQECVWQEYNRSKSFSAPSRSESCTGQIAISDIRVPVMWKDNVHFTGRTGDQLFYAFALIRCGNEVRDTPLYEVTSTDTDMYFDEPLVFEELQADFKMEFELYYTVITANERYGSKVPSKSTLIVKKRAVQFNAPKFALAGHTQLSVDDIKQGVISKDLLIGSKGASGVAVLGDASEFPAHPLELWGQFCCQLAAVPLCMREEIFLGSCFVAKMDNEFIEWYVVLYQCELSCWCNQNTYSKSSKPVDAIKLTQNTEITKDCLTIHIKSQAAQRSFRFSDESICSKYLTTLENCLLNLQVWKLACEEVMVIPQSKKNRISIPSKVSFYDQIVIEAPSPDLNRSNSFDLNRSSSFASTSSDNKDTEVLESKVLSHSEDLAQNITDVHNESNLSNNSDHDIEKNDEVFTTQPLTDMVKTETKSSITSDLSESSSSNLTHSLSSDELSHSASSIETCSFTETFKCTESLIDVFKESSSIFPSENSDINKNSKVTTANSNSFSCDSTAPNSTQTVSDCCIQESNSNDAVVTGLHHLDYFQNLTLKNQNYIENTELKYSNEFVNNSNFIKDQNSENSNLSESTLSNLVDSNNLVTDYVCYNLSDARSEAVVELDNGCTETQNLLTKESESNANCGDYGHTESSNNKIFDDNAYKNKEICDNNESNDSKRELFYNSDAETIPPSSDSYIMPKENLTDKVNTCQYKENLIQPDEIDTFQSKENATQSNTDSFYSEKNSVQPDQIDYFQSKEAILQPNEVDAFQFKQNARLSDEVNEVSETKQINILSFKEDDIVVQSENIDNSTTCPSQLVEERLNISSIDKICINDVDNDINVMNGFNKIAVSCNENSPENEAFLLNLPKDDTQPTIANNNEICHLCSEKVPNLETFHEKHDNAVAEISFVGCSKGSEC